MSRFSVDGAEPEGPNTLGLWESAFARAVRGPRGQRLLRELEAALLAMPDRRLAEGAIARDGMVCAVGAYVAMRRVNEGASWGQAIAALEAERGDGEDDDDLAAMWLGESLGMARTIAWELAFANDESYGGMMPEARHAAILRWVRRHIATEAVAP